MSDSSWSERLTNSVDGIEDDWPVCLTPWRTARSQSAAENPRVTLPAPLVRFGEAQYPTIAWSMRTRPPRSAA